MKKRRGRHGEFTSSCLVILLPMTILLIWAVMDVRTNGSGAWALLGVIAFMLACDIWFAGRVVSARRLPLRGALLGRGILSGLLQGRKCA